MLSDFALIWLFRGQLVQQGPQLLPTLWSGAGGLVLLDLTAGLPLGAILVVLGVDCLFPPSRGARRLLLLLLVIYLVYFAYHSIAAFRYTSVPFVLFVISGTLFVVLFLAFRLGVGTQASWSGTRTPTQRQTSRPAGRLVSSAPRGKLAVSLERQVLPSTRRWRQNWAISLSS